MTYHVHVAVTQMQWVEIESEKPLDWAEIKKLAEAQAQQEYGEDAVVSAD